MKKQNIINRDTLPCWMYQDTIITNIEQIIDIAKTDIPYGFIYVIGYSDNTFYIGKKTLFKFVDLPITFNTKKRINTVGKPFNKRKNGKLVLHETVRKETDWLKYTGSNEFDEPKAVVSRRILYIAVSKLHLTFLENRQLFNYILDPRCINISIDNKIFKDKVINDLKKVYADNYRFHL